MPPNIKKVMASVTRSTSSGFSEPGKQPSTRSTDAFLHRNLANLALYLTFTLYHLSLVLHACSLKSGPLHFADKNPGVGLYAGLRRVT